MTDANRQREVEDGREDYIEAERLGFAGDERPCLR